ncbi:hypothetical protein R9C00_07105 [Flammeovirgaceae bacterium SG7u.111]|nr:hypothetical protein [Flammeovirgaceae bacterium SG7u.132]WPO37212.1 hypothetical protein R9C00_07105 [Flammeovirgaceae bacterium SG7u.111]
MIAFYGFGGGFGHLTRIRTFIDTYKITSPVLILTNNPAAFRLFKQAEIAFLPSHLPFEKASLRWLVEKVLAENELEAFYIDVFPCGFLGELSNEFFREIPVHLLCRRLKWNKYAPQVTNAPLAISKAYIFEELENEHQQFIAENSSHLLNASLHFPSPANKPSAVEKLKKPIWLVVHTSQQEELEVLIDHAQDLAKIEQVEPEIVILSDLSVEIPTNAHLLSEENPIDWFPYAEKVFTAAGFNTWYQLQRWREKHIAIPFPRKFDDQFWRIANV